MSRGQQDKGERPVEFASVTRHCLLHAVNELAPNGIHAVLPASGSHKVKEFCRDLSDFAAAANPVKKRSGFNLPTPPLMNDLEIHKFFEGAVSVSQFVRLIEEKLTSVLPHDYKSEEIHKICWRYYESERKSEIAYPKWLSPTCTYHLWLIFNCLLGQSVGLYLPAYPMNELVKRLVELCGYTWNDTYQCLKKSEVDFPECIEAITDYFDKFGLETSLTCEVIADMVDEIVHGVLRKGYLTKKGHKRRNWKRRWFILHHTILMYYESREKLTLKGQLVLSSCTEVKSLQDNVPKRRMCRFRVTCGHTGIPFELFADDQRTKHEWMLAIKKAIALAHIIERSKKLEDFTKSLSGFYLLKYSISDFVLSRQDSEIRHTKYYMYFSKRTFQRKASVPISEEKDSDQEHFGSVKEPTEEYIPINPDGNLSSDDSSDEDESGYLKMYPAGRAGVGSLKPSSYGALLSFDRESSSPSDPGVSSRYIAHERGVYMGTKLEGGNETRSSETDSGWGSLGLSPPSEEDQEVASITRTKTQDLLSVHSDMMERPQSASPSNQYLNLLPLDSENPPVPPRRPRGSSLGKSPSHATVPHELVRRIATSPIMPDHTDSDDVPPPPPPPRARKRLASTYSPPPPVPIRTSSSILSMDQPHFQRIDESKSIINQQKRTQTQMKEQVKLPPLTPSIMTNTSHVLPESRPEFIDPVEIIHCDGSGGIYHNPMHGITLCIPEDAIPQGKHLEVSIGVCLFGDFSFVNGLSPVSAIVWLCSKNHTAFLKPVKVIIPHFLDCKSKEDAESLEMQFMKANHWNSAKKFVPADGEVDFTSVPNKGILHTHHFCYLCICAGVSPDQLKRCRFCIVCTIPRSITTASNVYFYVLYFLDTCIRSVEAHLDEGHFLHKPSTRVFRFSDVSHSVAAITGQYQCSAAQKPVTVTLQPTRISQDMIDFWQLHQNGELALMEKMKLYPPCMLLTFGDLSSCEEQVVTVLFRGTREPVEQMKIEIIVPSRKGTLIKTKTPPVQARPIPTLKDMPTLCELWLLKTEEMTPVRILRTLAPRWEELGTAVNFDPQGRHVRLIKKECGVEGPEACCKMVLIDWLCGKGGYQPPTWENMLKILEDMEEENLMITICKLLS